MSSGAGRVAVALRLRPVVLFGAGSLGRRILRALKGAGIEPCAFADNNPSLWGGRIDSTDILSPEQAASRFGRDGVFVMAVWHPSASGGLGKIDHQLRDLGCANVIPFAPVLWAYPQELLPHYLWDLPSKIDEEEAAIKEAASLFRDKDSLAEFTSQIEFRMTGNFRALLPVQTHPQYFPDFLQPMDEECFVDCGAYDGDSIAAFLNWSGGRFRKIVAFEADPSCFLKLEAFAATRPELKDRLLCHPRAVAAASGTVRFNATGQTGASISENGEIEVKSVTLDEAFKDAALKNDAPTFFKMDIEGAEPDALRGARETIRRTRPVVAVCVYHVQNHLWRIPLLLRDLLPEARFFLRSYCMDGWETVCYAVPEHRLNQNRGVL